MIFYTDKYFRLPYLSGNSKKEINGVMHYCAYGAAREVTGQDIDNLNKMPKNTVTAIVNLNDGYYHTEGEIKYSKDSTRHIKPNPQAARRVLYNILKHYNLIEEVFDLPTREEAVKEFSLGVIK